MTEYYISYYTIGKPDCTQKDNKPCFRKYVAPDNVIMSFRHWQRYCTNNHCPEPPTEVLRYCISIGDLSDDEIDIFKQYSPTANSDECKYKIESEKYDVSIQDKLKRRELLRETDKIITSRRSEIASTFRKFKEVVEDIRALRQPSTPPEQMLVKTVTPITAPTGNKCKPKSKVGRKQNKRTLWVIEQRKQGKSDADIFHQYNAMSDNERKKIDDKNYEKFNDVSNVSNLKPKSTESITE